MHPKQQDGYNSIGYERLCPRYVDSASGQSRRLFCSFPPIHLWKYDLTLCIHRFLETSLKKPVAVERFR